MGVTLSAPPTRPTSKSASTTPARCSPATAACWPRPPTSPSTWAPCRPRCSAALDRCAPFEPGDLVILNDPYLGGTHLPDITLVSPVFIGLPLSRHSAACSPTRHTPTPPLSLPRPPRRHRRHVARLDAALHRDLPGRPHHPAAQARRRRPAQRGRLGPDPAQRAHPRRAPGRPGRADRRPPHRRPRARWRSWPAMAWRKPWPTPRRSSPTPSASARADPQPPARPLCLHRLSGRRADRRLASGDDLPITWR